MLDPQVLFARKLLLITGKGGIGKTLLAATLGQAAAASGRRTLLVEGVSCDQLAPLFGTSSTDHLERTIAPNLDCINLDAKDNFRDYVVRYLGQPMLYDKIFSHRVLQSFISMIPGLAEVLMLGRLFYYSDLAPEPRYDLVIFDGPASGHFLSLMTTPDAVLHASLGGPLVRETERVRAFLADARKCGIIYVTAPEALVVSETLDFLPQLAAKSPAVLLGLAVNRMPPPALDAPDKSAGAPAAQESAAADYLARRTAAAHAAFATLRRGLDDLAAGDQPRLAPPLPLWTLPDLGSVDEPLRADFARQFLAGSGVQSEI